MGLLANMQEIEFGTTGLDGFCPVLFHLPLGFLVVMPHCTKDLEVFDEDFLRKFCDRDDYIIPAEIKKDSFKYYQGKLIAVDYGS